MVTRWGRFWAAASISRASARFMDMRAWQKTCLPASSAETIMAGRLGDCALEPIEIPADLAREWTVERDFIAAVKNPSEPRPRPTFEDGVAYMRVVQAVADSATAHRRVEV